MQIRVYLDVIFLINFMVDFFVLYLTGRILKQKINLWRICLAALFGAALLLPCIFYPFLLTGITGVILCTGISLGATFIAYGRKQGGIVKKWLLSTTIMILLGGAMSYIKNLTGVKSLQILVWIFILAAGIGVTTALIFILMKILQKENMIYLIKIYHDGKLRFDYMLLDTGNLLWDPLFGKPVIVLSEDVICSCMADAEREFIEIYQKKGYIDYERITALEAQKRVCFHEIACASIGNLSGKMLCLLIDEIAIEGTGRILKRQPVVIGPADLFKGKKYQGLLHKECI